MIRVASGVAIGDSPLAQPFLQKAPGPLDDEKGRTLYLTFLVLGVGSVLPTFVRVCAI